MNKLDGEVYAYIRGSSEIKHIEHMPCNKEQKFTTIFYSRVQQLFLIHTNMDVKQRTFVHELVSAVNSAMSYYYELRKKESIDDNGRYQHYTDLIDELWSIDQELLGY